MISKNRFFMTLKTQARDLISIPIKRNYLSDILRFLSRMMRIVKKTDRNLIEDYLNSNEIRKLHIGCGNHYLEGWLNTDYLPFLNKSILMDATRTFPFDSNIFDYIFTEHMIEHITYSQGGLMLSECFRVLKSGGQLRISTPDLHFLIDLYKENKSELQIDFIKHSSNQWIRNSPHYKNAPNFHETFVINNYVRAWGHQFIYDESVLCNLLEKVGFVKISRVYVSESQDMVLQNLENVSRKPPGLIDLESLVIECAKP
jgi:predicted SAM-dependent methyltransferase